MKIPYGYSLVNGEVVMNNEKAERYQSPVLEMK